MQSTEQIGPARTSREERESIKELQHDTTTQNLQTDKGSATVVLDTEDNGSKIHDLLTRSLKRS